MGDLTRKANMLMAKDGEIANYEGTRGIQSSFSFGVEAACDRSLLIRISGCSPVGNESTHSNETTFSAWHLRK